MSSALNISFMQSVIHNKASETQRLRRTLRDDTNYITRTLDGLDGSDLTSDLHVIFPYNSYLNTLGLLNYCLYYFLSNAYNYMYLI